MIPGQVALPCTLILLLLWFGSSPATAQSELCRIDAAKPGREVGTLSRTHDAVPVPQLFTVPEALHCPCPSTPRFVRNNDGSFEAALMWQGNGVAGDEAGALAEPFETPGGEPGSVCFMLIRAYSTTDDSTGVELIVWDDDDGRPGEILRTLSIDLLNIDAWPLGTQRNTDFDIESTIVAVEGKFWAGVRARSPADSCSILLGADLDGGGAMTYVAPGLGTPEGWQTIESVYGQDLSLGIGILVGDCVNPIAEKSWGQIKALYR